MNNMSRPEWPKMDGGFDFLSAIGLIGEHIFLINITFYEFKHLGLGVLFLEIIFQGNNSPKMRETKAILGNMEYRKKKNILFLGGSR